MTQALHYAAGLGLIDTTLGGDAMAFETNTARALVVATPRPGAGSHDRPPSWRRGLTGVLVLVMLGCGIANDAPLPPDIEDPATLRTPSGAMARYQATVLSFGAAVDRAMTIGGVLTDELAALPLPPSVAGPFTRVDSREDLSGVTEGLSNRLHRLRAQAHEGRGFVAAYAPDSSPALGAHLAALEGYAELYLADLFCSGIPLSTVDFDGDYTLAAGSTTSEVYQHAADLFHAALTEASDSARIQHLAAVGRGRALLALGRYAEAAEAVAAVPDEYQYQTPFQWLSSLELVPPDSAALFWLAVSGTSERVGGLSMGDQEGGVGLTYRSSGDPRTLPWTRTDVTDPAGNVMYFPRKYAPAPPPGDPVTPFPTISIIFTVASGIEARLIEAEAVLAAGSGTWLMTLNALRTTGTFDTQPNASNPALTDTLWHAGKGGVAGLRPLEDPGINVAQVDLLFRERAFWLYLTAHRQGDLRRLIRNYQRGATTVYPTGPYSGGTAESYGAELTVPAPASERELNSKYTGCFHRNA